MARTTATAVRALIGVDSSVDVDSYIEVATTLVDEIQSCYSDEKLELIERNLAGHYAFLSGITTKASVTSKSIDGASTSYSRTQLGSGLAGSPWGMMAMNLDTSKCLIGLLDNEVKMTWLGTE